MWPLFTLDELNPIWAILVPLLATPFIAILGEKCRNCRETVILITGSLTLLANIIIFNGLQQGKTIESGEQLLFTGLGLKLSAEPLGVLFALLASFLWIVTTIYSIGYMRSHNEKNQTRFYLCFAIAIAAVMGAAYADNMLTLFVAYEAITLSTLPLVTHAGTAAAQRAGRIYIITLMTASIGLLMPAMIWIWFETGTLDFMPGGILSESSLSPTLLAIMLGLIVFGTAKAALMPVHGWLPNAMVAPTPVSALLHAVAVVKTGVFLILKVVVYIFGLETISSAGISSWLIYISCATIIIASLIAMTKDNLKARLAYSTIGQLSYIVLAAMLATPESIVGGGLHIFVHAFGKITLFFCAGAILVSLHVKNISDLDGVGKQIPLTMFAFLIGSLAIIGLPPTAGLWSKLNIAIGSLDAEYLIPVAVLMLSSLLNIAYLLPIPVRAFFRDKTNTVNELSQATSTTPILGIEPMACKIAISITMVVCIALFFFANRILDVLYTLPL